MPARYEFLPEMLPLVVMVSHDALREEDIPGVFGHYKELARRRVRYVSVSDARAAKSMPDARLRKLLGEASREMQSETRDFALGVAVVIDSAILRGALTAIEWVAQPEQPSKYFGTMPEAVDWAIGAIEKSGLEVNARIRAYRKTLR